MGSRFSEEKRLGHSLNHPPTAKGEVKETVQLQLYSPSDLL